MTARNYSSVLASRKTHHRAHSLAIPLKFRSKGGEDLFSTTGRAVQVPSSDCISLGILAVSGMLCHVRSTCCEHQCSRLSCSKYAHSS